jgi:arabinofuranosyltransferase
MHGRVLLAPVFCLLAPVAVIPIAVPQGNWFARERGYLLGGAAAAMWLALAGWALWAANSAGMGSDATRVPSTCGATNTTMSARTSPWG